MEQWRYTYAGLRVHSNLEIPEWAGFEGAADSDEADVRFCLENGSQGWLTAPRWTLVNVALVLVQGVLPLAALYLMKRISVCMPPQAMWRNHK